MTGEHVTRQSPKGLLHNFVGEGLGTRRGEVLDSLLNKIISQDKELATSHHQKIETLIHFQSRF